MNRPRARAGRMPIISSVLMAEAGLAEGVGGGDPCSSGDGMRWMGTTSGCDDVSALAAEEEATAGSTGLEEVAGAGAEPSAAPAAAGVGTAPAAARRCG